jgi:pimeloyl-ACP methyl ester carboxylesterase
MSGILLDGHLVHYESWGRGKPVIFVHGWLGSWRYWFPIMEALAGEHRTYALDLWGFGDSDMGPERYDVRTYVDLLEAFMNALAFGPAPLVGHTLGAAVVAELAARYPDRVSHVLAVGLPLSSEAINRRLLTSGANDMLARLFWNRKEPYSEVEGSLPKIARNAIALTIQSVARGDWRRTLAAIEVPFLAVYGDKDPVIDHTHCTDVADSGPHARSIVLPEAHHFPMLDRCGQFARLLKDFLDVQGPQELEELSVKQEWRRRTR